MAGLEERRKELITKVPKMSMENRDTIASTAYDSGFAACLKKKMEAGTAGVDAYRSCKEEADLKKKYKELWGKETGK